MTSPTTQPHPATQDGSQQQAAASSGRDRPCAGDARQEEEAVSSAYTDLLSHCPLPSRQALQSLAFVPEDEMLFRSEFVALHETMKPFAAYDWNLARDIAFGTVEAARMRRTIADLTDDAMQTALREKLTELLPNAASHTIHATVVGYFKKDRSAIATVEQTLRDAGVGIGVIAARARCLHAASIDRMEKVLAAIEKRRDRMVREMKAERAALRRSVAVLEPGSVRSAKDHARSMKNGVRDRHVDGAGATDRDPHPDREAQADRDVDHGRGDEGRGGGHGR